jgi:hypothetical protein
MGEESSRPLEHYSEREVRIHSLIRKKRLAEFVKEAKLVVALSVCSSKVVPTVNTLQLTKAYNHHSSTSWVYISCSIYKT